MTDEFDRVDDEPVPRYPFRTIDPKSPKEAAWLVFSRLFVSRVDPLMCKTPKVFQQDLLENFDIVSTSINRSYVAFECDDNCTEIQPRHYEVIRANADMIKSMILKSRELYGHLASSLKEDEAQLMAAALGLSSVGRILPLRLENR